MTDRSHYRVRKYKLGEEPEYDEAAMAMTHGERINMVWELTKTAWAFHGGSCRTQPDD